MIRRWTESVLIAKKLHFVHRRTIPDGECFWSKIDDGVLLLEPIQSVEVHYDVDCPSKPGINFLMLPMFQSNTVIYST